MKKRVFALLMVLILAVTGVAAAHSGRTDSSGGHKDNQNKSGLGSYHYHCGGHPPHLHSGGVCPYSSASKATPKPTAKPAAQPTQAISAASVAQSGTKSSYDVSEIDVGTLIPEDLLPSDGEVSFGRTNTKGVNLRKSHTKKADTLGKTGDKGTVLIILDEVMTSSGEVWYYLWHNNKECYILADFVDMISYEEFWENY